MWNSCRYLRVRLALGGDAAEPGKLQSKASTVNWSMRWRLSSCSACAPVVHMFSSVGPVSMLPVIAGSLWTLTRDAIRAFEQARGLILPRAPPPPPS
jgi:hypothetical protein